MTRSSNELEAAEAMILLSKNTFDKLERDNLPHLRYIGKKVYIKFVVHEVDEMDYKMRFVYSKSSKLWSLHMLKGMCKMNCKVLFEGMVSAIPDKALFNVKGNKFYFYYDDKPRKQQKSYQRLIIDAIEASEMKRLTLSDIYNYFVFTAGFDEVDSATWKNSIRHNLSLNKIFVKTKRLKTEPPGKGSYWSIDENYNPDSNSTPPDNCFSQATSTDASIQACDKNRNVVNEHAIDGDENTIMGLNLKDTDSYLDNYPKTKLYTQPVSKQVCKDKIYHEHNNRKRRCTEEKFRKRQKCIHPIIRNNMIESIEKSTFEETQFLQENMADLPLFNIDSYEKRRSMSVTELSDEFEMMCIRGGRSKKKYQRKRF